jgi:hypothetical protein
MGAFWRKLRVKFQGVKIEQKQNYVHKTWENGILVLHESYKI